MVETIRIVLDRDFDMYDYMNGLSYYCLDDDEIPDFLVDYHLEVYPEKMPALKKKSVLTYSPKVTYSFVVEATRESVPIIVDVLSKLLQEIQNRKDDWRLVSFETIPS